MHGFFSTHLTERVFRVPLIVVVFWLNENWIEWRTSRYGVVLVYIHDLNSANSDKAAGGNFDDVIQHLIEFNVCRDVKLLLLFLSILIDTPIQFNVHANCFYYFNAIDHNQRQRPHFEWTIQCILTFQKWTKIWNLTLYCPCECVNDSLRKENARMQNLGAKIPSRLYAFMKKWIV